MRALLFVGRHPMRTQKDLVEHSGTDKAQIARMLNILEEKGWLERVPHANDARSRCLRLSPAGQAVYEGMGERRRGITAQMLDGFSPDEQQVLQGLLGVDAAIFPRAAPDRPAPSQCKAEQGRRDKIPRNNNAGMVT